MAKRKEWRCFFCDEVFRTRKSAWYHFGEEGCTSDVPACVDPLRTDEKARMKALREAQEWAMQRDRDAMKAEEEADRLRFYEGEIARLFGKGEKYPPRTPHQAWLKLEAAQNAAETWQLRAEKYRAVLSEQNITVPLMEWEMPVDPR